MVKKELFSVKDKKISKVYSSNNNNNKNNNNNNNNNNNDLPPLLSVFAL